MCVSCCYPTLVETPSSKIRYIEIHFPGWFIFKIHTCVLEKAKLILCIFDKLAIILHHRIEVCCFCFCSNISGLGQPYSCHLSCFLYSVAINSYSTLPNKRICSARTFPTRPFSKELIFIVLTRNVYLEVRTYTFIRPTRLLCR